jgi:hypothetical protein
MKYYEEYITKLKEDEVFVFGSNKDFGFHGAGSAGFASFGVSGNRWREFDYANKPNGWKGKWNVKGIGEGFQEGTEGKSYAIPTVTRAGAKRSRTQTEIMFSIRKFYKFAYDHPEWNFYVAQDAKGGLNGYSGEEMANMFGNIAVGDIPENIYFYKPFYDLVKGAQKCE